MIWSGLLALSALAPQIAAQCTTTLPAPSTPTRPADDPFWVAPSDLATRSQGSVFGCRAVNWNRINNASITYQYAYKTVNHNGTSIVSVATLILPSKPKNLVNGRYARLLSYQVAYNSPTSFCGPSFINDRNAPSSAASTYRYTEGEDVEPSLALRAGIPVVISDFEGSTASFGVGETAGYGVLNGIQAVLSSSKYFAANTSVALWGESGGSVATEYALELAGQTDLNIVGAALGALTSQARDTLNMVNGDRPNFPDSGQFIYNSLVPYLLLGIANENSTVRSWIQDNLKITKESLFERLTYKQRFNVAKSNACNSKTAFDYFSVDFNGWFNNLPKSGNIVDVPIISDALNMYGTMGQVGNRGRTIPTYPIYLYKGSFDGVSNMTNTDALYTKYCTANKGARIQYVRYMGVNHLKTQTVGGPAAWTYLLDRFNGVVAPGCSVTTVRSS